MKPWEPLLVGKICGCLAAKAKRRIEGVDSQVPYRIVKISLTETLKALGCRAWGMAPGAGVQHTSVWSEQSPKGFLIHQTLHSARL